MHSLQKYQGDDKIEMGKFVKMMYKEEIEIYMESKWNLLNELKEGNKLIGPGQSKTYSGSHLINLLLDGDSSSNANGGDDSS